MNCPNPECGKEMNPPYSLLNNAMNRIEIHRCSHCGTIVDIPIK